MTARLTDRERRQRGLARVIARGARFMPEAELLQGLLDTPECLIRLRRSGYGERFPIGDSVSWQKLEDLCCHRWAIMAEIARLRNDRPSA